MSYMEIYLPYDFYLIEIGLQSSEKGRKFSYRKSIRPPLDLNLPAPESAEEGDPNDKRRAV